MSGPLAITIDMDKKCAECGKTGRTATGICLACFTKGLRGKPLKSKEGRAVKQRIEAKQRTTNRAR